MSRIITFLGKTGTTHTILAIATAKQLTQHGKQVLFITHAPNSTAEVLLATPLASIPQVVAPNLQAVQLQATALLDDVWAELKSLLSIYLPMSAPYDELHAGEVVILPGIDSLLSFNALCKYYQGGDYEVIIYDGRNDNETLRLFGIPSTLDWYFRRFGRMFEGLDLSKIADSIGGPLAAAFLTANLDTQKLKQGFAQVRDWIDQGVAVVDDPQKITAYLITTDEPGAIADARWLWGSAQQAHLSVNGVLAYQYLDNLVTLQSSFAPLPIHPIPTLSQEHWEPVLAALPDFYDIPTIPAPITIDNAAHQITVFLPGFTKKQVKLTQYGSEVTVEAGDQRRSILLPPELCGRLVQSGKFEEPYLIIKFAETASPP
jgi:anion-transporting  ArsA/GET3 family ATPase